MFAGNYSIKPANIELFNIDMSVYVHGSVIKLMDMFSAYTYNKSWLILCYLQPAYIVCFAGCFQIIQPNYNIIDLS